METVEEVVLDETILDDEPGCEFDHGDIADCGIRVTHVVRGCTQGGLLCGCATEIVRTRIIGHRRCAGCGRDCSECWKLQPA